jgi:hypothetical protein
MNLYALTDNKSGVNTHDLYGLQGGRSPRCGNGGIRRRGACCCPTKIEEHNQRYQNCIREARIVLESSLDDANRDYRSDVALIDATEVVQTAACPQACDWAPEGTFREGCMLLCRNASAANASALRNIRYVLYASEVAGLYGAHAVAIVNCGIQNPCRDV